MTLSVNDTAKQHSFCYAECRHAKHSILKIILHFIMLRVVMLNAVVLGVIMLNVFVLNVFALSVIMLKCLC
jgi:hypothetical protein